MVKAASQTSARKEARKKKAAAKIGADAAATKEQKQAAKPLKEAAIEAAGALGHVLTMRWTFDASRNIWQQRCRRSRCIALAVLSPDRKNEHDPGFGGSAVKSQCKGGEVPKEDAPPEPIAPKLRDAADQALVEAGIEDGPVSPEAAMKAAQKAGATLSCAVCNEEFADTGAVLRHKCPEKPRKAPATGEDKGATPGGDLAALKAQRKAERTAGKRRGQGAKKPIKPSPLAGDAAADILLEVWHTARKRVERRLAADKPNAEKWDAVERAMTGEQATPDPAAALAEATGGTVVRGAYPPGDDWVAAEALEHGGEHLTGADKEAFDMIARLALTVGGDFADPVQVNAAVELTRGMSSFAIAYVVAGAIDRNGINLESLRSMISGRTATRLQNFELAAPPVSNVDRLVNIRDRLADAQRMRIHVQAMNEDIRQELASARAALDAMIAEAIGKEGSG